MAKIVQSRDKNGIVTPNQKAMITATRDGLVAETDGQRRHSTLAKVTIAIFAPHQHNSITTQSKAVMDPSRDRVIPKSGRQRWHITLALDIPPPSHHNSITTQSKAVETPTRDGLIPDT